MTVKELKEILANVDDSMEILVTSRKAWDNFPVWDVGVDDDFIEETSEWVKRFFIVSK